MRGVPTRASALNSLSKCSGLVAARAVDSGEAGAAADTGTGVGRGVELWHRGLAYNDVARTLKEEAPKDFPKAVLAEVQKTVLSYCNDVRNKPDYVCLDSLELTVQLTLPPDIDDPTGEPIVLSGHTDQVRWAFPDHPQREELGRQLWDVKNGRGSGDDMTRDYAFQLAAYTVALEGHYGPGEIALGGIIRTKGYSTRGVSDPSVAPVFFPMPWTLEQCHAILRTASYLIGQIRAGAIAHTPGSWCRYCPLDFPTCATGDLARLLDDPAPRALPIALPEGLDLSGLGA